MVPRGLLTIGAAIWLLGCTNTVPVEIRDPLPASPHLQAVLSDTERYQGQFVRWGGTVTAVHKQGGELIAEVEAAPLGESGRPVTSTGTGDRFLIRAPLGAEAGKYQVDRPLTVFGRLSGAAPALSGGVQLPVVEVHRAQTWLSASEYRQRQRARIHYFHYPYYYWPRSYRYGIHGFHDHFHRFGYWPRFYYYPFYRSPYFGFDPFYRW
jgi:outer membrane lipoprotein